MSFDLIAYDRLQQSVKESIKTLIEHHHPKRKGTIDLTKLGESVVLLKGNKEHRDVQSAFLLKMIELTETVDESQKTLLLNAAVYYIHRQIVATYRSESAADASTFNFSLKTSLGLATIEAKKQPNDDDEHTMFSALVTFLAGHVFKAEKQHLVYVDKHPFSTIDGYDAIADIKELTTAVAALVQKRLDTAKREHEAALRPATAGGLLGWMGLGGSTPKKTEESVAESAPTQKI